MNKWEIKKRNKKFVKKVSYYKPQDLVLDAFKNLINNLDKQKVIAYADKKCMNEYDEVSKYGIHIGNDFKINKNSDKEKFNLYNENYILCKKNVLNSLIPKDVRLEKKFYDNEIFKCFSKCEDVSQILDDKKLTKCYKKCKFNVVNFESDNRIKILESKKADIEKILEIDKILI